MPERIDVETARQLLDFRKGGGAGVISEAVADEQLRGAVALHNLLVSQNVAYLADEVGMGKTYVALGAMALLRHFQPQFRVLVVAPRGNIQRKWMKEWTNFTAKVVKVEDLRVTAIGGLPARALVAADSLADLVTETSHDPDRDFFARLTSFSLPGTGTGGVLDARRRQLREVVPWLGEDVLDARSPERYKRNFARAVNCALPTFDLVIIDEAHNLKAGWSETGSSIRNTVIGCALGGKVIDDEFAGAFRGYTRRAKRILFLSATPIESDIKQLWNQLHLLGFGSGWEALKDASLGHEEHRRIVRKLLIRRTAELHTKTGAFTKTEYRREWRGGGVTSHDEPMRLKDDRQRLSVALIQKKVSEVLGNGEHGHSFQVGLLASFESFLETVRARTRAPSGPAEAEEGDAAEESGFHKNPDEVAASRGEARDGADIDSINGIARDHVRQFRREMPHPKMDALVDQLTECLRTGRKALVFVRRVASVDEIQRKLEEQYDDLLIDRLRKTLNGDRLKVEVSAQFDAYRAARAESRHTLKARDQVADAERGAADEVSSVDSFFAWFFRGSGPESVRSGASLAIQMDKASGNYSTLFEDNYIAALLGVAPPEVPRALASYLEKTEAEVLRQVATAAEAYLSGGRRMRREQFQACQVATLELLGRSGAPLASDADVILKEVFPGIRRTGKAGGKALDAARWLSMPTFFSELRKRSELRERLWPEFAHPGFRERLLQREKRRELLSTMIRKGHAITDLFVLIVNRIGTLKLRSREGIDEGAEDLENTFLDLLEHQMRDEAGSFSSYYELAEAAANFELILQLNLPELERPTLADVATKLGRLLRAQRPVAGMAGSVNTEVVKQFRMPGYPLVLVTTDLLKEGEDLHSFCSSVHHYGIAWMPSELEQRVGRIDRVGSATQRRLAPLPDSLAGEDKLQVYYPHLKDTVEVLQLNRVYERVNRFLRLMHEGLGVPAKESPRIDLRVESVRSSHDIAPINAPLKSAFRVSEAMLQGRFKALAASARDAEDLASRFSGWVDLLRALDVRHVELCEPNRLVGEWVLASRVQPFTLLLRSVRGRAVVRCVSPIGRIASVDWDDETARRIAVAPFTRLALERNERYEGYTIAVEGDLALGRPRTDRSRLELLLNAVIATADDVERRLLETDLTLKDVDAGLRQEPSVER